VPMLQQRKRVREREGSVVWETTEDAHAMTLIQYKNYVRGN
jgi:hypothetical protein